MAVAMVASAEVAKATEAEATEAAAATEVVEMDWYLVAGSVEWGGCGRRWRTSNQVRRIHGVTLRWYVNVRAEIDNVLVTRRVDRIERPARWIAAWHIISRGEHV
jgi:hypothetical protein